MEKEGKDDRDVARLVDQVVDRTSVIDRPSRVVGSNPIGSDIYFLLSL